MKPSKSRNRRQSDTDPAGTFPDQSYLAYFRPTARPFLRFTSGHFPAGTLTTPHSHPCLALHGCLQGPLTLITAAGEERLDVGIFYLIAPGVRHHWRNDGRHTGTTLGLLIDTDSPGRWPAGTGVDVCCREIGSLADRLHRFSVAGDTELQHSYWLAADHLTAEAAREPVVTAGVLLTLLGQVRERLAAGPRTAVTQDDVARKIRQLLLNRVHDRLDIAEITSVVGVSPTRAKQAFREAFGCGIIAYFNQLKIWQAKRLLCDPSLTIEQVSYRLGFANPGYFSRVFAQHSGETPTDFRSQSDFDGTPAAP
jgi:AraC-like DNA-binding protein